MAAPTQLAVSSREQFLEAAQKEFARFEREESEFSKRLRAERAAELHLPLNLSVARNFTLNRAQ